MRDGGQRKNGCVPSELRPKSSASRVGVGVGEQLRLTGTR